LKLVACYAAAVSSYRPTVLLYLTRAIPERFRDEFLIKRYTNLRLLYLLHCTSRFLMCDLNVRAWPILC